MTSYNVEALNQKLRRIVYGKLIPKAILELRFIFYVALHMANSNKDLRFIIVELN